MTTLTNLAIGLTLLALCSVLNSVAIILLALS